MNPFTIYPPAPETYINKTRRAMADLLDSLATAQQNVRDADERAEYSHNNNDPERAAEFRRLAEDARDVEGAIYREYQTIGQIYMSMHN